MMIRRLWIFAAVIAAVLLLTSCAQDLPETQPAQSSVTTAPTTAPTAAPTTVPETEPSTEAPAEPTQPVWLRMPEYPTYEELFSTDRKYESYLYGATYITEWDSCSWFVMDGDTGIKYTVMQEEEYKNGERISSNFYIQSKLSYVRYEVWRTQEQRAKTLIGSDGRYAYIMDAEYVPGELCRIQQIDMLEGTAETVAEADFFMDAYLTCDAVLYYSAYEAADRKCRICRVYLPEMKEERLVEQEVPAVEFMLLQPESTLGNIEWYAMSQEIQTLLNKELSDPNSRYKFESLKKLWEEADPVWDLAWEKAIYNLCRELTEGETGAIFDTYRYDFRDGTVAVKQINRVPMEAGYDPSVCVLSPWEPLPGAEIQETLEIGILGSRAIPEIYGGGFYPGKLYLVKEGVVSKVVDDAVLQAKVYGNAVYCITEDKRVLQINHEGNVCNTLYTSQCDTLELWWYYDKNLFVREDNRILQIDLAELKYRTLLEFPEGIIVYNGHRQDNERTLAVTVHTKDAVFYHVFDIEEEVCVDTRPWASYGETASVVES